MVIINDVRSELTSVDEFEISSIYWAATEYSSNEDRALTLRLGVREDSTYGEEAYFYKDRVLVIAVRCIRDL